jgi:dTDP-4-amino-4,6-dideoxygalactose transaminase
MRTLDRRAARPPDPNFRGRSEHAGSALPYVDLARQHAGLKGERAGVGHVLDHAQFVLGAEVVGSAPLRGAVRRQARHEVNSGTDALVLALGALRRRSGRRGGHGPESFVATTAAIRARCARVFVDVRNDPNLDPERLEAALTPRRRRSFPCI